jgi:FkbM family methyltransferase
VASARELIKECARRLGVEITLVQPGTPFSRHRNRLLAERAVTLAVDVGASKGEYAAALRAEGFLEEIVSLEPLEGSYAELASVAAADERWHAFQVAAGAGDEIGILNVSGRPDCSSMLGMSNLHRRAAPGSAYVRDETIPVRRLDTILESAAVSEGPAFLKIDVQGYELHVLRGAPRFLERVCVLESELSLVTLYQGQPLFGEVVDELRGRGLALVALEPAFNDPATDEILQVNGLFARA